MSIDPKFVELTANALKKNFKIPTATIIVEKNKICVYIYIIFLPKYMTPPIEKKLAHIYVVYYKYQQRSLQR